MSDLVGYMAVLVAVGGCTFIGIEIALKLMIQLASKLEPGSRHSDQFQAMERKASRAAFWFALAAVGVTVAILFN
jgi:hypothetical protein